MSQFIVAATVIIDTFSAQDARERVEGAIDSGQRAGYFVSATVTSVEAYVPPRTYTQAEFDAAVLAAAENARTNALAGVNE